MIYSGLKTLAKLFLGITAIVFLFIFFMLMGTVSAPFLTSKQYSPDESPAYLFYVVVESFDPHWNRPQFLCFRWEEFHEMFQAVEDQDVYHCREADACRYYPVLPERDYKTTLSVPTGSCENLSSHFKVQNLDTHAQVVRLRWAEEAFKVRSSYRVAGKKLVPLHFCKFMSAGIAVNMFLIISVALPLTLILFSRCRKKYGIRITAAWALILAGLGTSYIAIFDSWLSLDPLTIDPEYFIFRSKVLMIISSFLFISAGILFWRHKKKRLATVKQA